MSAILEIPEVRQRVSPLTVEEYHRLDEFNEHGRRTELIRGILIEKMSKSPLHSSIAKRLYDWIKPLLPRGFIVRREDPITLADSEPEPDIAVVRGSEADFLNTHPTTAELVIEVAVSSGRGVGKDVLLIHFDGVADFPGGVRRRDHEIFHHDL